MLSYASQLYLTSEGAYPYTSGASGVNGACKVTASSAPAPGSLKLSGSGYYSTAADATSIMNAVTTGPVIVYFYVDASTSRGPGQGMQGLVYVRGAHQ